MNIQPNLPNVTQVPTSTKVVTKQALPNEGVDQKQAKDSQESNLLSSNNNDQAKLFEQIESLDNSQKTNFRASDIENKNQKSIQSYQDTQDLKDQALRDDLREQLGVDYSV